MTTPTPNPWWWMLTDLRGDRPLPTAPAAVVPAAPRRSCKRLIFGSIGYGKGTVPRRIPQRVMDTAAAWELAGAATAAAITIGRVDAPAVLNPLATVARGIG